LSVQSVCNHHFLGLKYGLKGSCPIIATSSKRGKTMFFKQKRSMFMHYRSTSKQNDREQSNNNDPTLILENRVTTIPPSFYIY
jgi:hypothetical protein